MMTLPESRGRTSRLLIGASLLFLLGGAAPAQGQGPNALGDFSLPDVNGTSSRFQQHVSPRDYLQQVSGWYFGHST